MAWAGAIPLSLSFDRIAYRLTPDSLAKKRILQIGIGSGGAPVCDHLTMNGVKNWILYDPDTLDEVNLVKHPRSRVDLGRRKVDIQRDWIMDRNPEATVVTRAEDVFASAQFSNDIASADLVLSCTDSRSARLYIARHAADLHKPCITASVFRQGFGGEVHAYIPGVSGCYECMDQIANTNGFNIDATTQPSPHESDVIYGLSLKDYRASGLSIEIQMISLIQARMALELLQPQLDTSRHQLLAAPWVIFFNSELNGVGGVLKTIRLRLTPQKECSCGKQQAGRSAS